MTKITILPEDKNYRAIGGQKESVGRTAGEALDGLTAQLSQEESGTLIVIQNQHSDKFFNSAQQMRLSELMEKRKNQMLSVTEQKELEDLVETELNGARQRAEELISELKP